MRQEVRGGDVQLRIVAIWLMLTAVVLALVACGQADPAGSPGGASLASAAAIATPPATSTRVAPFPADATPGGTPTTSRPPAEWINLPPDFSVRTAAQAETLAVRTAQEMFGASQPHVADTGLLTQREA